MKSSTAPKDTRHPDDPAERTGAAGAAPPLKLWIGAGIGAGIGSAAIAAALLYATRPKKGDRTR